MNVEEKNLVTHLVLVLVVGLSEFESIDDGVGVRDK